MNPISDIYREREREREREKDINREFRMPGKIICPSARKAVGIKTEIIIGSCSSSLKRLTHPSPA